MNNINKCCRCDKRVYPIEELKCLDKIWHKSCFKCGECNMTLNLKTYKGYDKMPYCNAHVPQVKYTPVVDTPEARRLAENTRIQSNIQYHQDFNKLKGKVTAVADDPETLRIRNQSRIISNVAYHGELDKKKQMEEKRSLLPDSNGMSIEKNQDSNVQGIKLNQQARNNNVIMSPSAQKATSNTSDRQQRLIQKQNPYLSSPSYQRYQEPVAEKDNNNPYYGNMAKSTVIYTSGRAPGLLAAVDESQTHKVGSIADYDPINDNYGSLAAGYPRTAQQQLYYSSHHPVAQNYRSTGRNYRAVYDYNAQDVDEVSFLDGDILINCQVVGEGWFNAQVQRTGQTGMVPANYLKLIN